MIFLLLQLLPDFFSRSATVLKLIQEQPLTLVPEATAAATVLAPVQPFQQIIHIHLSQEAAAVTAVMALPAQATRRGAMSPAPRCWPAITWAAVAELVPAPVLLVEVSVASRLAASCGWTEASQPMAPKALIPIPAAERGEAFFCRPKHFRARALFLLMAAQASLLTAAEAEVAASQFITPQTCSPDPFLRMVGPAPSMAVRGRFILLRAPITMGRSSLTIAVELEPTLRCRSQLDLILPSAAG